MPPAKKTPQPDAIEAPQPDPTDESVVDNNPPAGKQSGKLTAAQAAKRVKRIVPVLDDDGRPVIDPDTGEAETTSVSVKADEVFDFKDYGDHVVVVTTDGVKLRSGSGA